MKGQLSAEQLVRFHEEADKRYREASEQLAILEEKDLNEALSTLGEMAGRIQAGDRSAMLGLLSIAARSLEALPILPDETRNALADCFRRMESNLQTAKGFIPRGRGERSASETRAQEECEIETALWVEYARQFDGLTLEEAIAEVAAKSGATEHVVHKRWKRRHLVAKQSFELARHVCEGNGMHLPTKRPPRKGKRRL